VIPEIDIWRAADLILKLYGETARPECVMRTDKLTVAGGPDGVEVWRRITVPSRSLRTRHRLGRCTGKVNLLNRD
jgi:hypothetical protein